MSLFEPFFGSPMLSALRNTVIWVYFRSCLRKLDAGAVFQNPVWSSTCSGSATVWIINEAVVRQRARENKPWPLNMTRTRGLLLLLFLCSAWEPSDSSADTTCSPQNQIINPEVIFSGLWRIMVRLGLEIWGFIVRIIIPIVSILILSLMLAKFAQLNYANTKVLSQFCSKKLILFIQWGDITFIKSNSKHL